MVQFLRRQHETPSTSARFRVVASSCLLLLVAAPATAAVADYIGKPIASVRLLLEEREVVDPSLSDVIETQVGAPLSMADVRESITHLFSLGRFDDVRVDAEAAGSRVALRYLLSPIHPVETLEFTGAVNQPGIDVGALRRAITDRYAVPTVGRAVDMSEIVVDLLHQAGYLHPSVVPRAELQHRPDRATLIFTIEPGTRTRIGTVDIVGTPPISRAELLDRLGLAPGAPYEREVLNERIQRYVDARRSRGYFEARVMPSVQLADQDRVANVTLTVVPGPHVRVVFTGDPLPAEQRAALVSIEREGSADEDLLEDSSHAIEDYLKAQGYRDASAPHRREEHDGELVITFDVKKGREYRVDRVEVSGNASIALADFQPSLQVRAGQPFSGARLDADVQTIEGLYRRRGFAAVQVRSAVDPVETAPPPAGPVPVVVRITIREGVRTLVASVHIAGNASVAADVLEKGLGLQPGVAFFSAQLAVDRDTIELRYADLGFQSATVDANPGLSRDGTKADVVFTVHEGPRLKVDHILIVGNVRTSTSTIQHELQLKPGDPLGTAAVNESQRRLASLGLFRRVRITELGHGDETTRDLLVTVEEAPATTIGYGAGAELFQIVSSGTNNIASTSLQLAPRGSFEIGRRNLWGKNRSVNFFSSASVVPNQTTTGAPFTEYRLLGTYREPRLFNTAADAFVTAVQEQQYRPSFDFAERSITAELAHRVTRTISISGNYSLQKTKVFNEAVDPLLTNLIDRLFPQVRLSSFSTSLIRDTRNDPVDPTVGDYLSASGQLAARAIGSEVGLTKEFFTASLFRTVPGSRVVFAGDARLGLAAGFPRLVTGPNGQSVTVEDLPASERFFAGGDTTVRGFVLDTLGTPETIVNGLPVGGNGVVILNAELRAPVRGGLGVVGFVDTGNVFEHATDISLGELRTAVGFGVRYKSPVGPIRIDIGFKVHRETILGQREPLTAVHISLGQAF